MDQKTWLWKKRSLEKSIAANTEAEISVKANEEEKLQYEKEAAFERTTKNLHEKVASLLCECNVKDNLVAEHAKSVKEANAGRDKAEAELAIKKQELEEALQQKVAANERLVHLNAALKDYRQQLSSLKEEQDYKKLEEKFAEASRKVANLTAENAQMTKALIMKDELIEDISHQMSRATVEFNGLISRLDSTEKENDILKYEYRVLERELEIQNRCAEMANGRHQESAKRVAKLEAECQRLQLLVKKRITGNNKMRLEVDNNHLEAMDRRMSFVMKRLCEVEEENKILKNDLKLTQMRCDGSKNGYEIQYKMIGNQEMSLMEDFIEMEKLAIVSVDANNLDSIGKELVPVADGDAINEKVHKDLEAKLLESEENIISLKTEIENLEESKRLNEEHLENLKIINEDLDHQLTVAKVQINEALQKVSSLEVELEDRSHCCEELEATCLELQLQLASVSVKDVEKNDVDQEEKFLQTGWEIKEASAKLAECQETIFNLGKQLTALTLRTETAELTNDKKSTPHSSLRDHMLADIEVDDHMNSPKTKEIISTTETKEPYVVRSGSYNTSYEGKHIVPTALAIVPSKKRGKGTEFLRKLLFRRKGGSNKKKKMLTLGM